MNYIKIFSGLICWVSITSLSMAQRSNSQTWTSGRADGHAPITVMGDHTHNQGEIMFSYRFMHMTMDGMRAGTEPLSNSEVLNPEGENYVITPTQMPMDMHMIGVMYALTDHITLMGMVNLLNTSMDHQTRMGGTFTTESSGFGDICLTGLIRLFNKNRQRIHANLGISIPTGSIDQMDVTPMSAPNETLLPYPMQIGSGTLAVLPGLTYLLQGDKASLGAQIQGIIQLRSNDREYAQGTQTQMTLWGAYGFGKAFSASLRINASMMGEIQDADPTYGMMVANRMVPTVFPENFGGTVLSTFLGVNVYLPNGILKNLRLGLEGGLPVYRNLNGTQLETDLTTTLGIQYSF